MAIIFIPGIKGTELVDTYPLGQPRRWPMPEGEPGDLIENPGDFALVDGRHDRDGHWMQPGRVLHRIAAPMIHHLRAQLAPEPVYAFGYDWRKPVEVAAIHLGAMLDEIRARERAAGRPARLKFVTHSMGGLLLRSALAWRRPEDPLADVERIVFIAPPFRGALGAPYALVAGETDPWLGITPAYRKVARSFPSVYQLTPSWKGAAIAEDDGPLDLFDANHWQANVAGGSGFRADFLRDAEAFVRGRHARQGGHSRAPMLTDEALAASPDKVLIVCGSGQPTPCALPVLVDNRAHPNWFDFAHMRLDPRGDGRVWLPSAAIQGLPLVALTDTGAHALLCRDDRVRQLTTTWLAGDQTFIPTPRTANDPLQRESRSVKPWDGDPDTLDNHVA